MFKCIKNYKLTQYFLVIQEIFLNMMLTCHIDLISTTLMENNTTAII